MDISKSNAMIFAHSALADHPAIEATAGDFRMTFDDRGLRVERVSDGTLILAAGDAMPAPTKPLSGYHLKSSVTPDRKRFTVTLRNDDPIYRQKTVHADRWQTDTGGKLTFYTDGEPTATFAAGAWVGVE
jgi:hypothetical protein